MTPVFIFSLPRAGSTLLQRMLMGHPRVTSASEPWLLLPIAYMLPNEDGEIVGPYDHRLAQKAISDLAQCLPNKEAGYWRAAADFAGSIYSELSGEDATYFVDKTPRYYLIIPQIRMMFPEAKFIFLFRNPLAVVASIVETWGGGRFGQFYQNHVDLYSGPKLLMEGCSALGDSAISVHYEDLVSNPEVELSRILDYLKLDEGKMGLQLQPGERLKGRLGDRTGINKYNQVTTQSMDSWVGTYNTHVRRWFTKRYLKTIGDDVLSSMGYSREELLAVLHESEGRVTPGVLDAIDLIRVRVYQVLTSDSSWRALRKVLIPGNLMWRGTGSKE